MIQTLSKFVKNLYSILKVLGCKILILSFYYCCSFLNGQFLVGLKNIYKISIIFK